jgi:hypothetical protein
MIVATSMNTIKINSLKEVKMRFREKVLVLFVAICVSVLGFNLIASSSVCLLKAARASGYEPIQSYLVECAANFNRNEYIAQKTSQLTQLSTCLRLANAKASLLEERSDESLRKTQDQ